MVSTIIITILIFSFIVLLAVQMQITQLSREITEVEGRLKHIADDLDEIKSKSS